MSNQMTPPRAVNKNDNHASSWLRKGDLEASEQYARYIPLANAIIQKHSTLWYKTQPQTSEFQYVQMAICGLLHGRHAYSAAGLYQLISSLIECNPIALMNDKTIDLKGIH